MFLIDWYGAQLPRAVPKRCQTGTEQKFSQETLRQALDDI